MNKRRSRKNSKVRYLRLMNNMTLSELAYAINMDRMHLDRIEMGVLPCTEEKARLIAEYFDIPNDYEKLITRPVEYA